MREVPSKRLEAPAIPIPLDRVVAFCRRHGVRRLALFGSVLRSDFTPTSDVDVLVEISSGGGIGLFEFAGMENELSSILGRKVDLFTPASLSPHVRDHVLHSAEVLYAAAG